MVLGIYSCLHFSFSQVIGSPVASIVFVTLCSTICICPIPFAVFAIQAISIIPSGFWFSVEFGEWFRFTAIWAAFNHSPVCELFLPLWSMSSTDQGTIASESKIAPWFLLLQQFRSMMQTSPHNEPLPRLFQRHVLSSSFIRSVISLCVRLKALLVFSRCLASCMGYVRLPEYLLKSLAISV